jgi:hypothetical protein
LTAPGQQITRRFVRLVVPYSVALLLAVLVAALVGSWMDHPSVPGAPDLGQLVANALLLQDIVGEEALSAGVWYVAIDFQLFAGSVLLLALVRALCGDGARGTLAGWGVRWWWWARPCPCWCSTASRSWTCGPCISLAPMGSA